MALLVLYLMCTTSHLNVMNLGLESINGTRKRLSQASSSFLIGQDRFLTN
jgi:hypothetical protein